MRFWRQKGGGGGGDLQIVSRRQNMSDFFLQASLSVKYIKSPVKKSRRTRFYSRVTPVKKWNNFRSCDKFVFFLFLPWKMKNYAGENKITPVKKLEKLEKTRWKNPFCTWKQNNTRLRLDQGARNSTLGAKSFSQYSQKDEWNG